MMPTVSVVIPTCDRPDLVRRSIRSVTGQSFTDLEIIVVITGSDSKSTEAVIASFEDPRLRMIRLSPPARPAFARNAGVSAAAGRYIALLDDDDEWAPGKIGRQIAAIGERGLTGQGFHPVLPERRSAGFHNHGRTWRSVRPARLYDGAMHLGTYLLDRPSPISRPGLIASGTLLFPRSA